MMAPFNTNNIMQSEMQSCEVDDRCRKPAKARPATNRLGVFNGK